MDSQELKLLEDGLWEAADQLRANSKLTASECSMPVLGFILSSFLCMLEKRQSGF